MCQLHKVKKTFPIRELGRNRLMSKDRRYVVEDELLQEITNLFIDFFLALYLFHKVIMTALGL